MKEKRLRFTFIPHTERAIWPSIMIYQSWTFQEKEYYLINRIHCIVRGWLRFRRVDSKELRYAPIRKFATREFVIGKFMREKDASGLEEKALQLIYSLKYNKLAVF